MSKVNTYGGKDDWDDYDNSNTMRLAGDVVPLKLPSPTKPKPYHGPRYRPDDYLGEPSAIERYLKENPPANSPKE